MGVPPASVTYARLLALVAEAGGVTVSDTAPADPETGDLWYDTTYQLLNIYDGADWHTTSDHVLVEVRNDSGSDITKGQALYVSSTHSSGKPNVTLAVNTSGNMPAIGLADTDIGAGEEGYAIISGTLEKVDTSSFASGDALYVDSVAGALTATRPTGTNEKVQKVALVTRSHQTAGSLIVMGAGRTNDIPNDLVTLTGVPLGDSDLGTFNASLYGVRIPDNSDNKEAFQYLSSTLDAAYEEARQASNGVSGLDDDLQALVTYHGRYDTEAEARRAVNDSATVKVELYYTARPDGDGLAENEQSDASVPGTSTVERRLYFSDKFDADVNTAADWTAYTTQPADDETFDNAKASLLAGLDDTDATANTRGTLPVSLKLERQVTTELLLEDYPGAEVAWSVRKISGTYTGYCMKVRRASDNTEQDIGFDTDGNLDTAAIETFCTTSDGFVSVWYDQSGGGHNVANAFAAFQPKIYDGTAQEVLKVFDRPSLRFDDTPTYLTQGTQAIINTSGGYAFSVVGVNPDATNQAFGVLGSNSNVVVAGLARDGNAGANQIGMSVGGYHVNGTQITSSNQDKLYDATETQGIVHIANYGNTSGTNRNYWPTYPHLTFYANAQMQEFVAWHTDQSSNQSAIEADMETYYGLTTRELLDVYSGATAAYSVRRLRQFYTGSCMRVREDSGNTEADIGFDANGDLDTAAIASHCGSANGYVVTWYDQSGNGRDIGRSTTTGQPQIYNGTSVLTDNGKPILTATSNSHELEPVSGSWPTWGSTAYAFGVMKRAAARCIWLQAHTEGFRFFLVAESGLSTPHYSSVSSFTLWNNGSVWTPADRDDVWTGTASQSLVTTEANLSSWGSGLRLGGFGFGQRMYDMQEFVIYNSDQSSNQTGIESDINTYYSIY